MAIELTRDQIEAALPLIAPGLKTYVWLQAHRDANDLRTDLEYRRHFNSFYRIRRGKEWQDKFYDLFQSKKREIVSFPEVLRALHQATGRYEASFASKLVATIRTEMPVIDSIVLRNLNLRLPGYKSRDRAARIEQLHETLASWFHTFVTTETGSYLVKRFREEYPAAKISKVKMLDLVLWRTKPKNELQRKSARAAGSER
jgi:hypothetical protein